RGSRPAGALLDEPYLAAPLRKHDCPPISDGAAAIVLAAGDRARALCERPAWIAGIDHRIEPHALGARDLTRSPSTERAAREANAHERPIDVAELHAPFSPQELILRRALALPGSTAINPSGGALAANPIMVAGLVRLGEAAARVRPRDVGSVLAAKPRLRTGGAPMNRAAVIGVGQTRHAQKRTDVSIPGLLREAALRALEDAELTFRDLDAVVIGKAPDMFEGVMMPELFLAEALGAVGKPMMRVHTAGSVGGSTGLVAAHLVQAGVHRRVLAVAFEKQSESEAMWALSPKLPFQPPL